MAKTPAFNPATASERNVRVADAVKAYCRFPHPQGFALMIDGPWGSGKTHLIQSLERELAEEDPFKPLRKPLYISLYGVRDTGEIGDQIYQQLHPVLGHKYTRLLGAVARGALKASLKIDLTGDHHGGASISTQIPELKLSEIASGATQRVLVFDDFERAVMTTAEVFGFINPLVEHEGCKVLILANEEEVDKSDDYTRRKEKTVGRTLRMEADAKNALRSFLLLVEDEGARAYLESVEEEILSIFRASSLDNLRLLNQFVWVFEAFWLNLTPEQQTHAVAMRQLTTLLCAATLELRSGQTQPEAFKKADVNHFMDLRRKDPDPDTLAAEAVFKRYPTISFEGSLLAPETVREIVLDAAFPVASVQQQLRGHPFFEVPEGLPSWRALWHSPKLREPELAGVLARFQMDFDLRTFRAPEELLHVAGLSLWLSDIGQDGWDPSSIMERLRSYVTDALAPSHTSNGQASLTLHLRAGGAFGLVFYNQEDSRFKEIAEWIDKAATALRRATYQETAVALHRSMIADSQAFLRDVCFTEQGPARFARSAVLACIPANSFADTFVSLPRADQEHVAMALSIRYEQAPGEPELRSELPWFALVVENIQTRAAALPPILRYHLRNLVKQYLLKHIQPTSPEAGS